jgi:prepilin-type N-terminal cleavage/methylation domain-containing protein
MKSFIAKKTKSKKGGFTLIELIVAITIIAVLSVIAIVNYGGVSRRSRDSRRINDLERIRMALELYRQENKKYPISTTDLVPDYLQSWPKDPTNFRYDYSQLTDYTYTISAHVEDLGSTNISLSSGCSSSGSFNPRIMSRKLLS